MSESVEKIRRFGAVAAQTEKLPYSIEICDVRAHSLERVLACALNAQLGRAIFHAAQKEHPEQRILLRRGGRTIADSGE